jgi:hypothetical protein
VGVQTLHAPTRASYTARGSWATVVRRDAGVSLRGVQRVRVRDLVGVDFGLCLADAARGFETANRLNLRGSNQPIGGWHGFAIVHQRGILDDDRHASYITDNNLERALRTTSEKVRDRSKIIHG